MTLERGEDRLIVLRDPLNLSEPIAIDEVFSPILDLLDGHHSVAQVRQSLLMGGGMDVPEGDLRDFVRDLSRGGLLEDDRFRELWAAEHDRFSAAKVREPQLADLYYPAQVPALEAALADAIPLSPSRFDDEGGGLLGVMCPHQPLDLAGPILAPTLVGLPPAGAVDLVVVLGTDHNPGLTPYVLTDKDYATPIGNVSTDAELVGALQARVPWILREQMRHRHCASLELSALVLRHLYGDACPPALFILCGLTSLSRTESSDEVDELLSALEILLSRRRVLWWGSAELSHAGPAYGHPPLDERTAQDVEDHDRACLESLMAGRHEQLLRRCMDDLGQGRPSGTAAMTTLARLLPVGYRGELAGYRAIQTPGAQPGQLGIAGVRFFEP